MGTMMSTLLGADGKGNGQKQAKKQQTQKEPVGPLPRERLSPRMVTGTVFNWMGTFGFIDLHDPSTHSAHESAKKNKGRVYLSKKDWKGEELPKKGDELIFHLYADTSGLGAENA